MSSSTNQVIEGLGTHHIAVQTRDWEESLKKIINRLYFSLRNPYGGITQIERQIIIR